MRSVFLLALFSLCIGSCTPSIEVPEASFQGAWPSTLWVGDSLWGDVSTGETAWEQYKLEAKHFPGQGFTPDSTEGGFVFSKQGALFVSPFGTYEGILSTGLVFPSPLAPGPYRLILSALNKAGRTHTDTIFFQLRAPEDTLPAVSSWIQPPPALVSASDSLPFSLLLSDVNGFGVKAPLRWLRLRIKTGTTTHWQQDTPWPTDTITRKLPLPSVLGEARLWWLLQDMYGNQTHDSLSFTIQP